jgi:hypothetical protein
MRGPLCGSRAGPAHGRHQAGLKKIASRCGLPYMQNQGWRLIVAESPAPFPTPPLQLQRGNRLPCRRAGCNYSPCWQKFSVLFQVMAAQPTRPYRDCRGEGRNFHTGRQSQAYFKTYYWGNIKDNFILCDASLKSSRPIIASAIGRGPPISAAICNENTACAYMRAKNRPAILSLKMGG